MMNSLFNQALTKGSSPVILILKELNERRKARKEAEDAVRRAQQAEEQQYREDLRARWWPMLLEV